jgi:diketogulonate reductase-like aldo/keto reductase
MASKPKLIKLNNGLTCPIIGLGTTSMKNDEVIYQSIKDGTRLFDTASCYQNEEEVGKGIKRALDENIVKREDLFIITKMGIDEKENPETAIKNSLKRLQLDYVDLYLDHWPSGKNYNEPGKFKLIPIKETWGKMEKLVDLGLTKSIGVSNYNVQGLLIVLSECRIKPAFNEVEFHPYLYQKDLKEFCDKENIVILSYNPMVKGQYCQRSEKVIKEKNLDLFNENILQELAKKYDKTLGQIILNWHIHVGVVPIPGTFSPNRMKENLGATEFDMEEEDIQKINNSFKDKQYRFCDSYPVYGIDIFA